MSVDETADCLGVPAATVRTRYFRAKGLLRESLAPDIDFNFETAFGCAGPRCDRIVAGALTRPRALPAGRTRLSAVSSQGHRRSEEGREGSECGSPCTSRWLPSNTKN